MGFGSNPLGYLGTPDATTGVKGKVELATIAETTAGIRQDLACTPAGVAAVAISGAPDASISQKGIIEIATDGEAAAKASGSLALVPSNIPSIMAEPGAIGGTTPSTGAFTALSASGAFVLTGDQVTVAEGGTGAASLTDHGVMLGSGTSAVSVTGVGATNQVFIGQTGADPIWSDDVDLPGTLDVTGAATLDNSLTVAGTTTLNGALVVDDLTIDADKIDSSSTFEIDAVGAIQINSSGGTIGIGNDPVAQNINLGTGAAARVITVGNVTGATGIVMNVAAGNFALNGVAASTYSIGASTTTGTITIGGTAQTGTMTLGSSSGTNIVNVGAGEGATTVNIAGGATNAKVVNIATGAVANVVTIGSVTGVASLTLRAGTGNFSLDGAATTTYTFGPTTTSGTMNFGGTGANTGTMTIAGGTGAQTVNLANSTGGKTINIATGAGANAVVIGSTNTSSATTLQAGSGGINLTGADVNLSTSAKKISMKGGAATDFIGTAVLVAGTVTVNNTNIAAGDRIFLTHSTMGGTAAGILTYTISAGASFTITARKPADQTTETNDTSTISYFIVRQT